MGKKVHVDGVRRFIRSAPIFRARDVEMLVGDRGYSLLMLHNFAKKGEIHRITRGWYSVHDDPVLSVFAFSPAYLGLQEALSLRGIWEQETNVVVVTSSKVEPGTREVLGGKVIVHRVSPRYFFGFDYISSGGFSLPVSDVEKTLVDLVYFREPPGREVTRSLVGISDKKVLKGYLKRYPAGFVSKFESVVGI